MKKFQLPPDFPATQLWDVAIWNTPLEAIEAKGYTFHREHDDLDGYYYTEIEDEELGKILLMIRDGTPMKLGVDIMVQSDIFRDDALDAIRRRFGTTDQDFSWVTAWPHQPGIQLEFLDPNVWTEEKLAQVKKESSAWYWNRLQEENQKREDERFYKRLTEMSLHDLLQFAADRAAAAEESIPVASGISKQVAPSKEGRSIVTSGAASSEGRSAGST